MHDNLKNVALSSRQSLWAWFKVIFIGSIFVIADWITGFYLLFNGPQIGMAAGHVSGIGALLVLGILVIQYLTTYFLPSLLILLGFIKIPLFVVLANKQLVAHGMYQLYAYKRTDFIEPRIEKLINAILEKQPGFVKENPGWKKFRSKLLEENKRDTQSWISRKIIAYCLAKIKMDDVDFSDPATNYAEVISSKLSLFIAETLAPSMKYVWLVCGLNVVIIILAIVFRA
jgi:hypothetical protein